jgi:type IV secretory pathway TrbF-like protein
MKSAFSRPQERYGDSTPVDTPYRRAAQEWDHRIGSAVVSARNWRTMAFGLLVLELATLGGYVYERQNTHVATFVVPVDKYARPGRIEVAGAGYNPSQAELCYFVADWVRLVRSKSTDPIILRQNWTNAYHFVSSEAGAQLTAYARANDPFAKAGQQAVDVEIVSVLPRSPKTYQVQWRETVYDQGGRGETSNWTGLFGTTQKPPQNEAELRANPLGLLITSFQWSREL